MKIVCKRCKEEKNIEEFRTYPSNNVKVGTVCTECEKKFAKEGRDKYNKYIQMTQDEVFEEFENLPHSKRMYKLIIEGYDVSYNGDSVIIFGKEGKRVFAKDSTKEIYDIVYAMYCYEIGKKVAKDVRP